MMSLMAAEDQAAPRGRTALRDLVRDRRAELSLSYDRLASRCIDPDTGKKVTNGSWLHRLESGAAVTPPDLPQLRGLAAGLQLPLPSIQEAAGSQFFGINTVWSDDHETRALVRNYQAMSTEDQQRVRELITAWSSSQMRRGDGRPSG